MSENIVYNVLEVCKSFLRIIPRSALILNRFQKPREEFSFKIL